MRDAQTHGCILPEPHVLRWDGLLRDVMEGRVKGKKRSGKPRKGMISVLKEAFGKKRDEESDLENSQNKEKRGRSDGYAEMKKMAGERDGGGRCQEPAPGQRITDDDLK